MKIGIAGPIDLKLLNFNFKGERIPETLTFPMISHIINGLINRGHKVVAFATSGEINESSIVFEDENLTICIVKRVAHAGRDMFRTERKELIKLMKKNPCDIINAHWSYEFAWAALDSGIPTVVTLHDHAATVLKYQFHHYRMMRWLMNFIVLQKAKYLTVNSDYLFNLLSRRDQKKATVINNFYINGLEIDIEKAPPKQNILISVSNGFDKRKNIGTSLFAFAIIHRKFPAIEYHLLGGEMEENGFAYQFAKENNLLDGVVFHGAQPFDKVLNYITIAKAMIHPSREESFGMSVLESMLRGTLVIGGKDSGNIPHLLQQGSTGVICDINSPEDIANSVIKILNDETTANELRLKAYKYAKDNFNEDTIIESYINQYKRILNL
jgi:glycosyltransferase involved in cell wall biosynthesis